MFGRRTAALFALTSVLALGACTGSSGGGNGSTGTPHTPAPSAAASASGKPADAAAVAARIKASVLKLTSASFSVSFSGAGVSLSGSGSEKLSQGRLVALKIAQSASTGTTGPEAVVIGGKTYAKLPTSYTKSTKPWVLLKTNSSNKLIQEFATRLNPALSSVDATNLSAVVAASQSFRSQGSQLANGVPATKYTFVLEVAKLPKNLPVRAQLTQSKVTSVPIELYLDGQDRPVLITENFTLAGQAISLHATLSDFDKPVTITAPPASEVDTT